MNGISNAIGDGSINIMHNLLVKYSESGYPSESVPTSIVIEYRMKLRGYVLNEKTALFERPKFSEPSPINSVANQGQ